ncbi:MAG: LD-carboxypeptidase [Haliscomenobacteraceae bacterium CHB4]|nr:putative murein peptide carboxypeptidase [Saprospiraceae bacterium]MCE7924901.1 LD-carboxypeptidase [Haliscomenobacteraceae bacterium CHB4]
MQRRHFFKHAALAGLAAGVSLPFNKMAATDPAIKTRTLKPNRLREGATVALIAPAGPFTEDKLVNARRNFETLGFKVREGKNLYARHGYFAGTDEQRLSDLHQAFSDPAVDAVWCIRGGYGCTRLLPMIDFDLIKKNPKPFIGYSDVTALHLAIRQKTGLVTFHGPVAASDFPENTLQHFRAALLDPVLNYEIRIPGEKEEFPGEEFRPFAITPGEVRGKLTGGNLSLLAAMTGTPYFPSFKKKLVFIEDVGEQPYRIDRMLTQLLQATDLREAAGIALGVFFDCQPKPGTPSLALAETLRDRLGGLGIPVIYGMPFGHVPHQATFPYGIEAALNVEKGTLTLLESGVI